MIVIASNKPPSNVYGQRSVWNLATYLIGLRALTRQLGVSQHRMTSDDMTATTSQRCKLLPEEENQKRLLPRFSTKSQSGLLGVMIMSGSRRVEAPLNA